MTTTVERGERRFNGIIVHKSPQLLSDIASYLQKLLLPLVFWQRVAHKSFDPSALSPHLSAAPSASDNFSIALERGQLASR
jgi:hypothetical protein